MVGRGREAGGTVGTLPNRTRNRALGGERGTANTGGVGGRRAATAAGRARLGGATITTVKSFAIAAERARHYRHLGIVYAGIDYPAQHCLPEDDSMVQCHLRISSCSYLVFKLFFLCKSFA